jgi:hypothetical protein
MSEEKNISVPNNILFSKQWFREYWTIQSSLFLSFILFFYSGYKITLACLSHQPDYQVLRFVGWEVFAIGLAIGCLNDWAKKEKPQKYPKIWWTSLLIISLSMLLFLLSDLRQDFPDLTIHWTFYPWKHW